MKKKTLYLIPFLLLFLIPLWPDPDATGTFNVVCNQSQPDFLPKISKVLFELIPCNIIAWKIVQIIIIAIILLLIHQHYPLSSLGLIGFFPVFLLTFEDDLWAFLPIFYYSLMVLDFQTKPSLKDHPDWDERKNHFFHSIQDKLGDSRYRLFLLGLGILLTILLGSFVWKGSFLILSIILSFLIHAPLSIIPSIVYILYNNFDNWGGSSEAIIGTGFVIGQIGLFFILYHFLKGKKFNKKILWLLLSFEILVLFQPKWGEWLIIPMIPLLAEIVKDVRINFLGKWFFLIIIVFTILTAFPTGSDISLIKKAVFLQENGEKVSNDWGVGHYFEFYGGKTIQKGGAGKELDVSNGFWLGPDIGCETIDSSDSLFLQKC